MTEEVGLSSEYAHRFGRLVKKAAEGEVGPALDKLDPETSAKVLEISSEIHSLAGRGFRVWETERYQSTDGEKVGALQTRMSALEAVAELAGKWGNTELSAKARDALGKKDEINTTLHVIFSSMPGTLENDGSTHTAFDIGIERMGIGISQVVNSLEKGEPRDIEVLCVGNPLSVGGKVTPEMISEMEKVGAWSVQGELDADLIEDELKRGPNVSIVAQGQSWGGAEAVVAVRKLSARHNVRQRNVQEKMEAEDEVGFYENKEISFTTMAGESVERKITRPRVRVLSDDPTPMWGGKQLVRGAILSGLSDATKKYDDFLAKIWFPAHYRRHLSRLGIDVNDSSEQERLKKTGSKLMRDSLKEGPGKEFGGLWPKDARTYVRQAVSDKTLHQEQGEEIKSMVHQPGVEDKVSFYPRSGSHNFDRFKVTAMRRLGVVAKKISVQK